MAKESRTPIQFPVISSPSTPVSGKVLVYAKSDKHVYIKDDAGVETDLAAAGSGGATSARAFFLA